MFSFPVSSLFSPVSNLFSKSAHQDAIHKPQTKNFDRVNERMSDGVYPLHAAIRLGDVEKAKELLQNKADPSLRDHQNLSAYDYAILSEKKELIDLLFPQEAGKALEQALAKTNHTLSESRKIQAQVVKLEGNLRRLMTEQSAHLPVLNGLHKVLAEGNLSALKLMGPVDLSLNNHCQRVTPLHMAVLSRNEEMVKEVLGRVSSQDCLAKDSFGMTPLHYAAMLGLSSSLDDMLKRVKKEAEFHIDAFDPKQQYSLANLAVVAQQPKVLSVLCQNGANLDCVSANGCSAAHLLAVQVTDKDPLKVTTAQHILACYNLASIAFSLTMPQATWGLLASSLMTSAYLTGCDLRGQAIFWAGEILSTALAAGLQKYPFLKAVVDVWRVAAVCAPCLYAIGRSLRNFKYEGTKALHCAAVNSVIAGSTVFRARDSLSYLAKKVVAIKEGAWLNILPRYETVKAKQLEVQEARLKESQESLLQRQEKLAAKEASLMVEGKDVQYREREIRKKEEEFTTRTKKLEVKERSLTDWEDKLKIKESQQTGKIQELEQNLQQTTERKNALDMRERKISERERSFSQMSWFQRLFYNYYSRPSADQQERHITFGTTYINGNALRDEMSKLVDANQAEYAERWGMTHRVVTDNLLKKQCTVDDKKVDCSVYWNKIAVLKGWLEDTSSPKGKEEWYVIADDDMAVTNMRIDPYKAIDALRRGKDTSVIVAEDVFPYDGNRKTSINTGLLFVRKDDAARKLIESIWESRNSNSNRPTTICPTLGYCGQQQSLHEQEALSRILKNDPSLIGRVISVVPPRDTYEGQELAINTFERSGSFIRKEPGWETECFNYDGLDNGYPKGAWRIGDWLAQTAGVPLWGWFCSDKENGLPPGPIRKDKLVNMISHVKR